MIILRSSRIFALLLSAVMLAVFAPATAARADVLYDIRTHQVGTTEVTFFEPSILTSITTINSFLTSTSTSLTVTSLTVDPIASGVCPEFGLPGPCLLQNLSGGISEEFAQLPVFTSFGTFTQDDAVTITISPVASTVPEPMPAALTLLGATLASALVFKKSLFQS